MPDYYSHGMRTCAALQVRVASQAPLLVTPICYIEASNYSSCIQLYPTFNSTNATADSVLDYCGLVRMPLDISLCLCLSNISNMSNTRPTLGKPLVISLGPQTALCRRSKWHLEHAWAC